MECQICDKVECANVCQMCGYTLWPLQEFMEELTGDYDWRQTGALLNPLDKDHVNIVRAFFCGMQVCFDVKDDLIVRTDRPIYRPLTMEEANI